MPERVFTILSHAAPGAANTQWPHISQLAGSALGLRLPARMQNWQRGNREVLFSHLLLPLCKGFQTHVTYLYSNSEKSWLQECLLGN